MKRYRVLGLHFDFRAQILDLKISDDWDESVQELQRDNIVKVIQGLVAEYGFKEAEQKIRNFKDMGPAPFSVVAYHNKFFSQVRDAFVMSAYYPALVGACALGERILNHLVIDLRDKYRHTPEYKRVYGKKSFDDWKFVVNVLQAWGVLLPEVAKKFEEFAALRNKAVHFDPAVDKDDRNLALKAINLLSFIIGQQFGVFGGQPWFIPNIKGAIFIRREAETLPFIEVYFLPHCVYVSPYHRLESVMSENGVVFRVVDECQEIDECREDEEISDEEFARLYNNATSSGDRA